jgi:hypothetical protein
VPLLVRLADEDADFRRAYFNGCDYVTVSEHGEKYLFEIPIR